MPFDPNKYKVQPPPPVTGTFDPNKYKTVPGVPPSVVKPAPFASPQQQVVDFAQLSAQISKDLAAGKPVAAMISNVRAAMQLVGLSGNVSESALTGGKGWRAALREHGVSDGGSFSPAAIGSFVLSVALDPTTYIGVGAVSKAVRGIKGLRAVAKVGLRRGVTHEVAEALVTTPVDEVVTAVGKQAGKEAGELIPELGARRAPEQIGLGLPGTRQAPALPSGVSAPPARVTGQSALPGMERLPAAPSGVTGSPARVVKQQPLIEGLPVEPLPPKQGKLFQLSTAQRALKTTLDLSAPFRQGIVAVVGHPITAAKSFPAMLRFAGSEGGVRALNESIVQGANYSIKKKVGLAMTTLADETDILAREEAFMGNLAERIPLGIGRLVRASNRAYSGFLTKLRSDLFDDMTISARKAGVTLDDDFYRSLAEYVNTSTGRGGLGQWAANAQGFSQIAFAPRLLSSRWNMLGLSDATGLLTGKGGGYYAHLHPFVRKRALRSMAGMAALGMSILGVAKAGGAEVGLNPTASDFGKIKIGNTRIDIWGGFQQWAVLFTRLATMSTTTGAGEKVSLRSGKYGAPTGESVALNFALGKLSPGGAVIRDWLRGQTFEGEPFQAAKEIPKSFMPLIIEDFIDLVKEEGWSHAPLILPAVFGVGVQTYKPKPPKKYY